MLIKKPADVPSSDITPKGLYLDRYEFLAGSALLGAAAVAGKRFGELISPASTARATQQRSSRSLRRSQAPVRMTGYEKSEILRCVAAHRG
jgi:hypothetical protein